MATDTDFRALCAELLRSLEQYPTQPPRDRDLIRRATAALAEGDGVGPSDEELESLCEEHEFGVEGYESVECLQGLINDAIARYGTHPRPIPVEERLPTAADCPADGPAKGKCWWWDDDDDKWCLQDHSFYLLCWTHWRPAAAIPLPEEQD